jgi:hypothetical protein
MTDGTISGNTAYGINYWDGRFLGAGGGVFLNLTSVFTKTGGIITSYNSNNENGNVVRDEDNGVVQNGYGHAVYAVSTGGGVIKRKEITAGPSVNLSFNGSTSAFSGAWDY